VVTKLFGYGAGGHCVVWLWNWLSLHCVDMELVVTILCGYGTGSHYIVWI